MILPNTKGVEGVKILVDGSLRSVTDKDIYYKIDQVYLNVLFEVVSLVHWLLPNYS